MKHGCKKIVMWIRGTPILQTYEWTTSKPQTFVKSRWINSSMVFTVINAIRPLYQRLG